MLLESICPDATRAAAQLADEIAAQLRDGISACGAASLVVSGGKSPIPFFESLRTQVLDWSRVTITLADERWVSVDSPDSNERLLREHLLKDGAHAARFVPLKTSAETPEEGLAAATQALQAISFPFDAVVLGMGEDGHTASLFPAMPGLAAALDPAEKNFLVAGVAPVQPSARISLSLAALLNTRGIWLSIQGEKKSLVYREAKAGASVLQYPIAAVLQQSRTPVRVLRVER